MDSWFCQLYLYESERNEIVRFRTRLADFSFKQLTVTHHAHQTFTIFKNEDAFHVLNTDLPDIPKEKIADLINTTHE